MIGMHVNVSFDANQLLRDITTAINSSGNCTSNVMAVLETTAFETSYLYNVMVCDLSQSYSKNLKGIKFFRAVNISGTQYGVWVFESGTFRNNGQRGYNHWAFTGTHDFTDGQKNPLVTFKK